MNCFFQTTTRPFDQLLFTLIAPRAFESKRSGVRSGLFDFPREPIGRRRFEPGGRPEEDDERWDGLS